MKEQGKQYTDAHRQSQHSTVSVGEEVLLQQRKHDKFTTQFETEPYKVVDRTGSQVTIQSPSGVQYKRNVSLTKPFIRSEQANEQTDTAHEKKTQITRDA